MPRRSRLLTIAVTTVLLMACGGGDDGIEPGWAIVKVELTEGPALASICIDSQCEAFDPRADVRRGEFSAFVAPDTRFEILRVGDPEGAQGPSPVGGCMLVRIGAESTDFVGGCGAAG